MSGQGRDNGNVASGSENTTKRRLSNTPEKPPAKRTTVTEYIYSDNDDIDDADPADAVDVEVGRKALKSAITDALKDANTLESISESILSGILKALDPMVNGRVTAAVAPLKQLIKSKDSEINELQKRITKLENHAEEQEQYSRRTCLRFSNIPHDKANGTEAESPSDLDTDAIVRDVCSKVGVTVTNDDIGRSHIVGTPADGRCQIIARFLSYRVRHKVYSSKSKLKGDSKKRFICEDLTRKRYSIVKHLSTLWRAGRVSQYWTNDGRIFMRIDEEGPTILVKTIEDINDQLSNVSNDTTVD